MLKSNHPLYKEFRQRAKASIGYLPDAPNRDRIVGYKDFIQKEKGEVKKLHEDGASGLEVCHANAVLLDIIIESIFRTALLTFSEKHGVLPSKCSLIGHGGYGRGELSPHSDVDIMFLFPDDVRPGLVAEMKKVLTDEVLYPLWDLGFKVGHSTRTIKECIEESDSDFKTRNSLLDGRLVLGSSEIYKSLKHCFRDHLNKSGPLKFVEELIKVQEKRRQQHGGVAIVAEPNIKNGVGGLRDYQGIMWMAQLVYGNSNINPLYRHEGLYDTESKAFDAAYGFLLRVRNDLHFNSKRATDELTLGKQPIIAEHLGYDGSPIERVRQLMRDYTLHARNQLNIARSLEDRLQEMAESRSQKKNGVIPSWFGKKSVTHQLGNFNVSGRVADPIHPGIFDEEPSELIKVFGLLQSGDYRFSFQLKRLIQAKAADFPDETFELKEVKEAFAGIVENVGRVHPALVAMYDLGVLQRLLPEFESLHCYVQHDRHLLLYTEDQKVLNSIRSLDAYVAKNLQERVPELPDFDHSDSLKDLYWMLLTYALGEPQKGDGTKAQPSLSDRSLFQVLERLGLSSQRVKRLVAFIESQKNVAQFWQRLEDEDILFVDQLASRLASIEYAKLSYWFYCCESLGKNSGFWETRPPEHYDRIFMVLLRRIGNGSNFSTDGSEQPLSHRVMIRTDIAPEGIPGISTEEVEAHFHLLPERYFASRNANDVTLHIKLVHELLESIREADSLGSLRPVVDWKSDPETGIVTINVVTWDRLGLFYKLAGAISATGINILKARAVSRSDHIAIDTFYVRPEKTDEKHLESVKARFEEKVESILVNGVKAFEMVREEYQKINDRRYGSVSASPFDVALPVQVEIYEDDSVKHIVVDYQGSDRIGLLYRISRTLFHHGLNIDMVRIATNNQIASGTLILTHDKNAAKSTYLDYELIRERLIAILSSEVWLDD